MVSAAPLVLYHGAHHWEGPPQLHAASVKQQEHGAGLYLTTAWATAKKYAKGGGVVMRFELNPNLRWLHKAKIPVAQMEAFLRGRDRLRNRNAILADIRAYAARVHKDEISADVLSNLMVNHNALTGDHGVALAQFYVAHGIDADHIQHGGEDWVLLFNMDKIERYRRTTRQEFDDAPRIRRENPVRRWFHASPIGGLRELKRTTEPTRLDSAGLWFTTDGDFAQKNFGPHLYEAQKPICEDPVLGDEEQLYKSWSIYWDRKLVERFVPARLRGFVPGGPPESWNDASQAEAEDVWNRVKFDVRYIRAWRNAQLAAGRKCFLFADLEGFDGWSGKQDILFVLSPEVIPVRQIR